MNASIKTLLSLLLLNVGAIVSAHAAIDTPSDTGSNSDDAKTPQTFARFVPERSDDFAWENDLIAFRTFGPALHDGKSGSGIDCWLKRVDYPIINKWYKQDKEGKSYHKDRGEGLDNYHVGTSAGTGGTGLWIDGKREQLENYIEYEIIEVTPASSRFKLIYERAINGAVYREEKTISIQLGQRLFTADCIFYKDGKLAPDLPVCVGITTHNGKATPFSNEAKGWIAAWEALGKSELGTAVRMQPSRIDEIKIVAKKKKDRSHIFLIAKTDENGALHYEAGYGWKKAGGIQTRDEWEAYLNLPK